MLKIKVEVNGVFNRQLIRKAMMITLPETAAIDTLLSAVASQLKLANSFEGSPIILLNGSRIDSKEVQLRDGDTLSFFSPLTGG